MDRKQFTFYASFLRGIERIRNKAARCDAYDAIVKYALCGLEPDLSSLPDAAAIAFEMARPNIDASRKKAEAGRKGGAICLSEEDKQTVSKPQANRKQTEAKPKQEKEQEQDKDKEQGQMSIVSVGASAAPPAGGTDGTPPKRIVFRPPTLDEVAQYCAERHNNVDPQKFIDFYESKGWMIGKNRMRDWKAAVRTWEKRDDGKTQTSGFLGIVEEMRGGDTHDDTGDWADIGLPGDTVPAELPLPLE